MKVEGEAAKLYNAIRLDNFENVNRGELVSADDVTGCVVWRDAAGENKTITLGQHMIKILPVKR